MEKQFRYFIRRGFTVVAGNGDLHVGRYQFFFRCSTLVVISCDKCIASAPDFCN